MKRCTSTSTDQSPRELVVERNEPLSNWCHVGTDFSTGDPSRKNVVLYGAATAGGRERVHVRVQGFIRKHDLRALGNWEGLVHCRNLDTKMIAYWNVQHERARFESHSISNFVWSRRRRHRRRVHETDDRFASTTTIRVRV